MNDVTDRTRLEAQRIIETVADLNREASLQQEAWLFIAKVRAA